MTDISFVKMAKLVGDPDCYRVYVGGIVVGTFMPDPDNSPLPPILVHASDLLAACEEFLPILDRQLESINPGGAAEESKAFQFAKARLQRMRSAIARAHGEKG